MEITASSSDPIRQLDELKTFYQLRIAELQCEVKILKQKLNSSCEDYEDEIQPNPPALRPNPELKRTPSYQDYDEPTISHRNSD